MATGGRVRCEYFYDTNDEYVSGVWAQSIACSVLSSQQFGERYLEELCNQKYQIKYFFAKIIGCNIVNIQKIVLRKF